MAQASDSQGSKAPQVPNHLIHEKSPYLLQHAYNPVDWYPWGPEAFAKAKRENKPIFLSIGYATCHWCHVMERECFEDPEVAKLMNATFVSIKVDREERPDIDEVYMAVCQMLTGSGGWPLTIVMTPDKKPFFAGTFFPKNSRFGRPGLMDLIPRISQLWQTRRSDLLASAAKITAQLDQPKSPSKSAAISASTLDSAFSALQSRYDATYGGFGTAPKFPTPHNLTFLLRYWRAKRSPAALQMVEKTLVEMRRGGMYDHVGFGFHRYSTDRRWLVPHFEKMLYDQAMLTTAYLEAYQATGKEIYAQTAHEILTYVLRDMTSPEGAFYSAEDADSEGVEGKFYLWKSNELKQLLTPKELKVVVAAWNIEPEGNYADEITGESGGQNILHRTLSYADLARQLKVSAGDFRKTLAVARQKLFVARARRIRPFRDDKVLTDWNGMMIGALAHAGRVLGEPKYTRAAKRTAAFLLSTLHDARGRLMHRYREGQVSIPGFLDDSAFLTRGLIELYETTFDPSYLDQALKLTDSMLKSFSAPDGGLFMTAKGSEELLVRPRSSYDGAIPSGVSVVLDDLLRLARLTGRETYSERANRLISSLAGDVRRAPSAHTFLLGAFSTLHAPTFEVVIVGDPHRDGTHRILAPVRRSYLPGSVVLVTPSGKAGARVRALAPFTSSHRQIDGKPTAYVCRNFSCNLPTTDPNLVAEQISNEVNLRSSSPR